MRYVKSVLWSLLFLTQAAVAEQTIDLGDAAQFSYSGFIVEEFHRNTNQSQGLANCNYTNDPRGVFGTYCKPGLASTLSGIPLNIEQLGGDLSHEFDSAWKVDFRLTYRIRNGYADVSGQPIFDRNMGVSHPVYGEVRAGTMLSRTWSRSDSFTYPLGLTSPWSESGAGFNVLPQAVRYSGPTYEFDGGRKLMLEVTYATNDVRYAHNAFLSTTSYNEAPPKPKLWEFFAQYSDVSNLIEYTYQQSRGGQQSSWGKGGFVGDVGNADGLGIIAPGAYTVPQASVNILQGNHYFNPNWFATFGVRRNYWSGTAYQCDYVPSIGCYFPSGFNNATDNMGHEAWSVDMMGGLSHIDGLWTYTAGFVRLNKAFTKTPTEYGQSNTATVVNLGIYRKVPEVSKYLKVYGGLGQVRFGRYGPAPLSMPSELAFFGVDPRTNSYGTLLTIGANLTF